MLRGPQGVFFCFRIIVVSAWWILWSVASQSCVCLEWLRMGTNGIFPGCMARSRRDLENPFRKSLVRSKAFGKIHGTSTAISMRFSLLTKDLEGAEFQHHEKVFRHPE